MAWFLLWGFLVIALPFLFGPQFFCVTILHLFLLLSHYLYSLIFSCHVSDLTFTFCCAIFFFHSIGAVDITVLSCLHLLVAYLLNYILTYSLLLVFYLNIVFAFCLVLTFAPNPDPTARFWPTMIVRFPFSNKFTAVSNLGASNILQFIPIHELGFMFTYNETDLRNNLVALPHWDLKLTSKKGNFLNV